MTHMTHTLRQPAHAAAACAGLALLLGACAPATPQADPTPTATDGCAYLLKAANTSPEYYFDSLPQGWGQKRTSLKGGNGQGPYPWVNKDLSIGQSAVVDGVGTFTLLAITPGAREYNPRFITFCFDPDPSLDLNEEEMKKFSAR